jgi:hypothetical protein
LPVAIAKSDAHCDDMPPLKDFVGMAALDANCVSDAGCGGGDGE